jgi:hypothetical protein
MKTVPFRKVFDYTVELHGRNPEAELSPDLARALVSHINRRVRLACQPWPWPEWQLTEERAFRQVWHADAQYLRVSLVDGHPDEVFYIPDTSYYTVNPDAAADPPPGTSPAGSPSIGSGNSSDFFLKLDLVDPFIAYEQTCKRSIGMVLGVYQHNPRSAADSCCNGALNFMPSEKGIDVCGCGPTVFITYKMPVPRYTITPYVVGKVYSKGDIVFDHASSEVFQALTATAFVPPTESVWRRVPFPETWLEYVCQGAFADSLMEFDQGGNTEAQAKVVLSQYANAKAEKSIQTEIDALMAQGQKFRWNWPRPYSSCWCYSQPWSGGTVSTLTDACEDELGWVYPTPTVTPGVVYRYYNKVVALRAVTAQPSLDQIATRYLFDDSIAQIKINWQGVPTFMTWTIVNGPAGPSDPNGEVRPLDYDAVNNDKHWLRLS